MMPPNIYDKLRDEADQMADYDKEIEVYASDIDPEMIEIAKRNAEEVGLSDIIQFSVKDVNTLTIDSEGPVALVGNPPYGERIGDREEVEEMYRYIGTLMKEHPYLSTYILTSNKEFEYLVNRKATKRRKLFNGYIECTYYQYWGKNLNLNHKVYFLFFSCNSNNLVNQFIRTLIATVVQLNKSVLILKIII